MDASTQLGELIDEITQKHLDELREEMAPYKDTLVLDYFKVVRLEGVEYDPGDKDWPSDLFWVYRKLDGHTYWSSCCGKWMPLKGKITDEEYEWLEHVWKLNCTITI
jgi:hypothetical protein